MGGEFTLSPDMVLGTKAMEVKWLERWGRRWVGFEGDPRLPETVHLERCSYAAWFKHGDGIGINHMPFVCTPCFEVRYRKSRTPRGGGRPSSLTADGLSGTRGTALYKGWQKHRSPHPPPPHPYSWRGRGTTRPGWAHADCRLTAQMVLCLMKTRCKPSSSPVPPYTPSRLAPLGPPRVVSVSSYAVLFIEVITRPAALQRQNSVTLCHSRSMAPVTPRQPPIPCSCPLTPRDKQPGLRWVDVAA
ncbi:hypothetical protein HaLaN_19648 [Haematococcus lacustris]|uniref:Uncharacterized protein n=1 Tax=Haematococcus lacustris TaxID=44745 RepID=A0A699ZRA3_HAELA|nr:hypothetical protein HaLaN_19648 [Haematococcus lacustris]